MPPGKVMTTRRTCGMLQPYKGMLLAMSKDISNCPPTAMSLMVSLSKQAKAIEMVLDGITPLNAGKRFVQCETAF